MSFLPDSIAKALDAASQAIQCPRRIDEGGHPYFDAEDVVPRAAAAFRSVRLKLVSVSFDLKDVAGFLAIQRGGVIRHEDGSEFPVGCSWLVNRTMAPGPAMNAALTQSTAGLYRVALDLVSGVVEEKQAAHKLLTDTSAVGQSPRQKQSGSGAHMSRRRAEENRERIDPDAITAELEAAAIEAFGGDHKDEASGVASGVESTTSGTSPAVDISRSGDTPQTRTEIPAPPAEDTSSSAGHSNESSAGVEELPPSSPSTPAPGPSELVQPTPEQVALVASAASGVLSKRVAEGRAGKWSTATKRKARKDCLCAECHSQIAAGEEHWDGGKKRAHLACRDRLEMAALKSESEAAGAGKEVA